MNAQEFEIELIDQVNEFYADPLSFVQFIFPWGEGDLKDHTGPDDWQTDLLKASGDTITEDIDNIIQSATTTGHGTGKSALTAWLILWAMSTRPHLNGVVTANTFPQLQTKTWRELAVWHNRALNKHWFKWTATKFFHVDEPKTWFVTPIANSEHNSEAFAGQHAEHVLIIYDEASAIPKIIWEVSMGAMTTPGAMWFAFGNPTKNTGSFYECFHSQSHRWDTHQIDSRTCKMTNKKLLNEWAEDYGEDSDFFRIRVKGEFPRVSDNQFISSEIVAHSAERELPPQTFAGYPVVLGVDVARFGGDESVIIKRQGTKAFDCKTFTELDTMELTAKVFDEYQKSKAQAVFVDGGGVGGGVVDRLKQLNVPVVDVQFGAQATDKKMYANMRAQMWGEMREWLKGDVDIPRDERLQRQLCSPEYGYNNMMQIQLERKDKMKQRGEDSPDRADALAVTFASFMPNRSQKPRMIQQTNAAGWS